MLELSPKQLQMMERLFEAGFRSVAIPPYENALCVRKRECAAVLGPVKNGGLKILAPPSYVVDGKLSARVRRASRDVFVWKDREVEATPERLRELEIFRRELAALLDISLEQ
jgi:hypothetical protein